MHLFLNDLPNKLVLKCNFCTTNFNHIVVALKPHKKISIKKATSQGYTIPKIKLHGPYKKVLIREPI